MEIVRFRLTLSAEQMRAYYAGAVNQVIVQATDGRRVQFPAQTLRRFVMTEGISGVFEMRFDAQHKLLDLRRIGD